MDDAETLHFIKVIKGTDKVDATKVMQAWDANGDGKVTKTEFIRRLSGYIAHERPAWLPRIRAMANRTAVRLSCENSPLGKVCAELFRAFDTDNNGFLDNNEASMLLGSAVQSSLGSESSDPEAKGYKVISGIIAEFGAKADQTVSLADFVNAVTECDWPRDEKTAILQLLNEKALALRQAHLNALLAQMQTREAAATGPTQRSNVTTGPGGQSANFLTQPASAAHTPHNQHLGQSVKENEECSCIVS